mgnify:CR=1 FL=1
MAEQSDRSGNPIAGNWGSLLFFLALYAVYIAGLVLNWSFDDLVYSIIERPVAPVAPTP